MSDRDGGMIWLGPGDAADDVSPETVGSKAAGIWRMAQLGLPTPPAFVLPTGFCAEVNEHPARGAERIAPGLRAGIERLEAATGRRFGDPRNPLLVSVRSGAAASMPGMLSTVLNVGLNAKTVHGLIRLTGDPRFAWDSYRRFIESYAAVVGDVPSAAFSHRLSALIAAEGVPSETELDGEALERLCAAYGDIAAGPYRTPVPDDPLDQLTQAALAVYRSWDGRKAREYRRINHLEGLAGTAVTVQAMVFGNAARGSGSGVAFSRDPATGEKRLYIDFLFNAQGEDVVSGRRTPLDAARFADRLPGLFTELQNGASLLEHDSRDVQDIEFTVEDGTLYFLQTRNAKRTPLALLRSTVGLVEDGLLDPDTALSRLDAVDLSRAAITHFTDSADPVASAISASPGVASGRAAFTSERARQLAAEGDPVILIREEPATDDIEGFDVAAGILTAVGGRTSHAAVVARQLGKVCLVGCHALAIDRRGTSAMLSDHRVREGDWLSLDGTTGEVSLGQRTIATRDPQQDLDKLSGWRNKIPV